jgi:hypothetical protein
VDYFYRKVDTRSRQSMVAFLMRHARYNTMNSWNRATSYAHCVKVHRLGLASAEWAKAYDVLQAAEVSDAWQPVMDEFTDDWDGRATIGFNGRSGGYLVLYESEYQDSEYRSYCSACGQQNYQISTVESCLCGRCGAAARVNYDVAPRKLVVWPGRGMDESRDFGDWPMSHLKERVRLVHAFDRACDRIRDNFIDMIHRFDVVDEEFSVIRTRKVLVESAAAA